ncbi:hypothetical protein [Nocardioides sp.]|jgi:Mce-associated membrane protein|uniref:hypothetical protein n=1 Tax=Nocardioides sp. TaxID=35761 RepID=UPI0031FE881B|nr:hypothetical protein [Nocardioides sp.]
MTDDVRRNRTLKILCAVLALALVAALAGVVLLWRDRADDHAREDAGIAAEKAARSAVTRMTTYDYRTVNDDFAWVKDAGTAAFQGYFAKVSKDAIAFIKTVKASATGTIKDSAFVVEDDEHVRVLVFVDQKITSKDQKNSKTDLPRVTLHMVLQDGHWLVDQVGINDLLTG